MKTPVLNIAPGKTVDYHGEPCLVLEHRKDGTLMLHLDQMTHAFGSSNNFAASSLRSHLNGPYLRSLTDGSPDEIITRTVDLTALNGSKEYGTCECKVAPLTLDELRKYHDILPLPERFEWSVTPWSTPKVNKDDTWVMGPHSNGNVYLDTASAIASMGSNAGRAFSNNDELVGFMELINKSFVIGGASAEGQSAAMLQLTQAMAAGTLRGEELNSILENAPSIARAIESYMGIAEGSIKQYAEQGLVTAEVVKNAMFASADEINAKFESMPMTWAQIATKMKNTALAAFDPVLTRLNQVANSAQFNTVINGAINGLAMLATVATGVLDLLINGASFVVENWSWISPIVYGLVAAFIAYNTVALITNGINGIMALAEGVKAAALMMSTGATFAATAAQYGLNAALLACPITWIVVLVIALVAAIYAACSAIAKFTGIANSGFGVIAGGINVVIQFFVNLGLTVANIALGIWNALGACAQNIGIAFGNVIAGVQSWFYNLLSTALTVVAGICEALNKLPFVEFDYSGITNAASDYAAKAAEASGNMQDFVSVASYCNRWSGRRTPERPRRSSV